MDYKNIYGQVPAALRETRLTLRDIMTDFLGTKTQESKMKLALAQIDAEKQATSLEGEKMKMGHEVNLAEIAAEKDWRTERTGFESQRLGEFTRHHKEIEETEAGKLKMAQSEQDYLNEAMKPSEWASTIGLSKTQRGIFLRYFPDEIPIKRRDITQVRDNIIKNPIIHYKYALLGNIDKLEDMQARLQDPKISPVEKAQLATQYDATYQQVNRLKRLIDFIDKGKTKMTPKDMATLKEDAMEYWETSDDALKTQYGNNYRNFEKAYIKDYMDVLNQGALNLKELKRKPAAKESPEKEKGMPALSAKDEKWFTDGINKVGKLKGKAAEQATFNAVKRFIKKGDVVQAKRLIRILLGKKEETPGPESLKGSLGKPGPSYKGSFTDVFDAMRKK